MTAYTDYLLEIEDEKNGTCIRNRLRMGNWSRI